MGAKFSKGGKVKQNGTDAAHDESLDTFNKTSTLPASFRKKEAEITQSGTLPRSGGDLNRSTSFSKRFRKSITKLVAQKEVSENEIASDSQVPTEPSSVVLGHGECEDKLKDVIEEEVDSKERSPHKTPRKEVLVTPHREIDPKIAQKRARAQFFQELYNSKEPVHIPKPPRSRNIPSPLEKVDTDSDVKVPAANVIGTPVVKLIEKHEEAIEKQHKHIEANNTINSPESERKETDSIINIPDVSSESIINEDVVCEKQVEDIKREEIMKEEITLGEEIILKEEIAMTQSVPKAPTSDAVIEQGYRTKIEDIESNHNTESISENAKSVSDLIANETVDVLDNVRIEAKVPETVVTEALEKKTEINPSEIKSSYENGSVSFDTDGNSSDSLITNKEDGNILNDTVEENNKITIIESRSNEALDNNSEKQENEASIVVASSTLESGEHVLDVEIIEEVEVNAYICGDDKNKPSLDEEVYAHVSMSGDDESKDDILKSKDDSKTIPEIDLDEKLETILTKEANENLLNCEPKSIAVTSLSAENCEKCPDVENNKEQVESMDISSDNKDKVKVDESTVNNASTIITEKGEVKLDQDNSQSIDEKIMQGMEKAQCETEIAKVEFVNSSHESCQVITEMASHDETNKIIDQDKSCNIEQKIQDDNFTELDSLESINQNDVINPTVTEKEDTIESTGTRCLADDTVIVDSEAKSPDDLRSEGGSEGGVSTDEGIVASDDEENKSNFHKVDSLAADKNKSNDELSDPYEPQNKL